MDSAWSWPTERLQSSRPDGLSSVRSFRAPCFTYIQTRGSIPTCLLFLIRWLLLLCVVYLIGFAICFYLNVLIRCFNIFPALYSFRHAPSACVRPGQRERPRVRESFWISVSGYVSHLASISINPDRSISALVFVEGLHSGIIHFIWTVLIPPQEFVSAARTLSVLSLLKYDH